MDGNTHLIIAGTGRAGTTLLVDLLAELGLDTGRERLEYFPEANAGRELHLPDPDAPYVVKDPTLKVGALIESGHLVADDIDAIVVPVRDLKTATLSRKLRSASTIKAKVPGGMTGTLNPWRQEAVLAKRVHQLLEDAAEYDIDLELIAFPRFAQDPDYAYRRLAPLVGPHCKQSAFVRAWRRVVDPDLVHHGDPHSSLWLDLRLAIKGIIVVSASALRRIFQTR